MVTLNVTEYWPGAVKQFCITGKSPPKSQFCVTILPPVTVDISVKFTHNGAQPETISALNATVAKGKTVIVTLSIAAGEQPSLAVTV